jgi:hypothetical protein
MSSGVKLIFKEMLTITKNNLQGGIILHKKTRGQRPRVFFTV